MKIQLDSNTYKVQLPDETLAGGRGTLAKGLVGLWIFDSDTGIIKDETGLTGNLIVTGNPNLTQKDGYSGLYFSGAGGQYATLANSDYIKNITDEYTWLLVGSIDADNGAVINQYGDTYDDMWMYANAGKTYFEPVADGIVSLNINNNAFGTTGGFIAHANQTTGDMDIANNLDSASSTNTLLANSGKDIFFAGDADANNPPTGNWFEGIIARVALFNRELTAQEKADFIVNPHLLDREINYKVQE